MSKIAKTIMIVSFMVVFLVFSCVVMLKLFLPSFYIRANTILEFPTYDFDELSEKQMLLVEMAKSTLGDEKPKSFYESVPMNEPWCANYVSYLYREIGLAFVNPVSGSWRIPGIYTLREYLMQDGFWRDAEYNPEVGDIVIYDGGVLGGHTNIVLKVDGDELVTIGGNEGDAVRIQKFEYKNPIYGLVGFGHIISE